MTFEFQDNCANKLQNTTATTFSTACKINGFPTTYFLQEQHFLCQFVKYILILPLTIKKETVLKSNFGIKICRIN